MSMSPLHDLSSEASDVIGMQDGSTASGQDVAATAFGHEGRHETDEQRDGDGDDKSDDGARSNTTSGVDVCVPIVFPTGMKRFPT